MQTSLGGGGISNPIRYTQSAYIDENKGIFCQRCTWRDNGSRRLGGGEFRLKGWFRRNVASGSVYVGIELGGSPKCLQGPGRIYTIAFKAKCNQPVEGTTNLRVNATVNGGMISVYYNKQPVMTSEYSESVMIVSVNDYNYPSTPMFMIVPENTQTIGYDDVYIDVTFKDLRVFEGAYVNPPIGRSLDNSKAPLFLDNHFSFYEPFKYGFPAQPVRHITFPFADAELKKNVRIYLSRKYLGTVGVPHIFVAYLYEMMGEQYVGNNFKRYLIKYLARNYNNTAAVRHQSITKEDAFDMTYPTGVGTDRQITWTMNGFIDSGKYSYCTLQGTTTSKLPNAVHIFIQPLVVYDNSEYESEYPHFATFDSYSYFN